MWARSSELDAGLTAVGQKGLVDELATVVCVDATQRNGSVVRSVASASTMSEPSSVRTRPRVRNSETRLAPSPLLPPALHGARPRRKAARPSIVGPAPSRTPGPSRSEFPNRELSLARGCGKAVLTEDSHCPGGRPWRCGAAAGPARREPSARCTATKPIIRLFEPQTGAYQTGSSRCDSTVRIGTRSSSQAVSNTSAAL